MLSAPHSSDPSPHPDKVCYFFLINVIRHLYDQYSLLKVCMVPGQGDQQPISPGNEDMSDFGSGSDLPLSAGDASPVKVAADRVTPQRDEGVRSRADSVRSLRSSGCVICVHAKLIVIVDSLEGKATE